MPKWSNIQSKMLFEAVASQTAPYDEQTEEEGIFVYSNLFANSNYFLDFYRGKKVWLIGLCSCTNLFIKVMETLKSRGVIKDIEGIIAEPWHSGVTTHYGYPCLDNKTFWRLNEEHPDAFALFPSRFDDFLANFDRLSKQNGLDYGPEEFAKKMDKAFAFYSPLKKQYFDVWEPRAYECYWSLGVERGDDIQAFKQWKGDANYDIVGFDPAPYEDHNVQFVQTALSNFKGFAPFKGTCDGDFRIADEGKQCRVDMLDNYIGKFPAPTFLKMDIEGEELNALAGGKELIMKHKPRLAISIYHNWDDARKIFALLSDWLPDAVFSCRHYSMARTETILLVDPMP